MSATRWMWRSGGSRCVTAVCAALLQALLLHGAAYAQSTTEDAPTPAAEPTPADATAPANAQGDTAWVLQPPADFASEEEMTRTLDERVASLEQAAAATTDPLRAAECRLAAANLILSRIIEPAATELLLGRAPEAGPVHERLLHCRTQLDAADEGLQGVTAEPQDAEDPARRLRRQLRTLRAFHAAFDALFAEREGEDRERALRLASSDLAVLLEAESGEVAAAASLWNAVLRSRSAEPDRALATLDYATAEVRRPTARLDFYARLLRCQVLATRGSHAVALALLAQLEDRCEEWFTTRTDREDALRAVTVVELAVLGSWQESFAPQMQQERDWCAQRLDELRLDRFTEGVTVLRLQEAVPMLPGLGDIAPSTSANP